jgi:hypothetical protein
MKRGSLVRRVARSDLAELLGNEFGSVQVSIGKPKYKKLIWIRNHVPVAVFHFRQEVVIVCNPQCVNGGVVQADIGSESESFDFGRDIGG